MGDNSLIIEENPNGEPEFATAWLDKNGRQFGNHKLYGTSFSSGENAIETVTEIVAKDKNGNIITNADGSYPLRFNGHRSYEVSIEGSPGTVLTEPLHEGMQKDVIQFYADLAEKSGNAR